MEAMQEGQDLSLGEEREGAAAVPAEHLSWKMTTMLPTSPNWYCGQVADCSLDGVYAYGAKSDVQLLHIKSRQFVGALRGHDDRVTSLDFDKVPKRTGGAARLCVSGAADATVRVWDTRTLQCLALHRLHKVSLSTYNLRLTTAHDLTL
jgi:WD40 repeat protein